MALFLGNDQLYFLPTAVSETFLHCHPCPSRRPTLFFSNFPNPITRYPVFAADDTESRSQIAILGYVEDDNDSDKHRDKLLKTVPTPGEIFIPLRFQLPQVGHTLDPSWSTPENPIPLPGSGKAIQKYHELRRGVIKERIEERKKREKVPALAELTLPEEKLRRLTTLDIRLEKKLKVGKAGITEGIVEWDSREVEEVLGGQDQVSVCRINMKRTHELLDVRIEC